MRITYEEIIKELDGCISYIHQDAYKQGYLDCEKNIQTDQKHYSEINLFKKLLDLLEFINETNVVDTNPKMIITKIIITMLEDIIRRK